MLTSKTKFVDRCEVDMDYSELLSIIISCGVLAYVLFSERSDTN